ncbi:unnamed protein product [Oppiella nova]|uniref:RNA-binding protein 42 n=1 Tax=Oppiella nova TaxID=334625 RepID=A0A7R9LCE1_9ACAR|nr:unnamed protein product [Oppiella nova]CAG2161258.1 unnamed protein product [Oppiella nova]
MNSSYQAMINERKRMEMEAEMSRFEQEISSRPAFPNSQPSFAANPMQSAPTPHHQFIPHAIQRQLPRPQPSAHHPMHASYDSQPNVNAMNSGLQSTVPAANTAPTTATSGGAAAATGGPAVASKKSKSKEDKGKKPKKMLRMAGGTVWEDNTLAEWDPEDFRIFCGDLGNDVTDDVLSRAFVRFPSFVKAKVIRDKRSNKSRGYGFVSFKDPQDFTRAIKEMNDKRSNKSRGYGFVSFKDPQDFTRAIKEMNDVF